MLLLVSVHGCQGGSLPHLCEQALPQAGLCGVMLHVSSIASPVLTLGQALLQWMTS